MSNDIHAHSCGHLESSPASGVHGRRSGFTSQHVNDAPPMRTSSDPRSVERKTAWHTVLQRTTNDSMRVMDHVLRVLQGDDDADTQQTTTLARHSSGEESGQDKSQPSMQGKANCSRSDRPLRHARADECAPPDALPTMPLVSRERLATLFDELCISFGALCDEGSSDELIANFVGQLRKEMQKDTRSRSDLAHRVQAACGASSSQLLSFAGAEATPLPHCSASPSVPHSSCPDADMRSSLCDDGDQDGNVSQTQTCFDAPSYRDGGAYRPGTIGTALNDDNDANAEEGVVDARATLSRAALRQCMRERSEKVANLMDGDASARRGSCSSCALPSNRSAPDSVSIGDYLLHRWMSKHKASANEL